MPMPESFLQLAGGHHQQMSQDTMLDKLEQSIESNPHLPNVSYPEPKESRILSKVENHVMQQNPPVNPVDLRPVEVRPQGSPVSPAAYGNPFGEHVNPEPVRVDPAILDDRFRHGSFPSPQLEGYAWKDKKIFYREPDPPRPRLGTPKRPKSGGTRKPGMRYCRKKKRGISIDKDCKNCSEYDPHLPVYNFCKFEKREADKLAKKAK